MRWRGRYNEDTILSIDMLKAGWCTILFYAFLQNKVTTQTMNGGNAQELYLSEDGQMKKRGEKYARNGTLDKSKMLVKVHPDVAHLKWRYDRWHHHVDFHKFDGLKLVRKQDIELPASSDNYGLVLKKVTKGE